MTSILEEQSFQKSAAIFFDDAIKLSQKFVSVTGATGIAGFTFHLREDEEVSLENDITDHYTETNNPVQDNIVNKPVKVTLRGTIGEYLYTPAKTQTSWEKLANKLSKPTKKLITIASYLPPINNYTQQMFDTIKSQKNALNKVLDIGVDAFKMYRDINIPKNNQSSAFLYFEALWQSKQVFTIQTPYRFYTDMAIQSVKAVQSGETIDRSDFEITFKQIRKVQTNDITSSVLQGRLKQMAKEYSKKAISRGKEVAISTVKGWF